MMVTYFIFVTTVIKNLCCVRLKAVKCLTVKLQYRKAYRKNISSALSCVITNDQFIGFRLWRIQIKQFQYHMITVTHHNIRGGTQNATLLLQGFRYKRRNVIFGFCDIFYIVVRQTLFCKRWNILRKNTVRKLLLFMQKIASQAAETKYYYLRYTTDNIPENILANIRFCMQATKNFAKRT